MTDPGGYFRFPTIHDDTIVFVSEDDLWCVSSEGGYARRLSANPGQASHPALSPDGSQLAFASQDEGATEVFVMPLAGGGPARRLTYSGSMTMVQGWGRDGKAILFASDMAQPHMADWHLWEISPQGGAPRPVKVGPAMSITYQPDGRGAVLWRNTGGRHLGDPAWWKRYRGGRIGQLWIDPGGTGRYRRLLELKGDLASPIWIEKRIYFLSDLEGVGNLYSCLPSGKDLRRHTDHETYYARSPKSDGRRIVYTAGADLYLYDPEKDETRRLEVHTGSTRPQRNRKFVPAHRFVQHCALHPEGMALCMTVRGKPFAFALWEGAVTQFGKPDGVRYRLAQWLPDGKRLVAISDEGGEDRIAILEEGGRGGVTRRLELEGDIGRVQQLEVSPVGPARVALTNHRNEVLVADLRSRKAKLVERSLERNIQGISWSPDGRWLAYAFPVSLTGFQIKLYDTVKGKITAATGPDFGDIWPVFDPKGDYLYFVSLREFDPVYDNQIFDLGFPRGMRILALPLRKDLPSPFEPQPRPPAEDANRKPPVEKPVSEPKEVKIDLDDMARRLVACPIPEGRFGRLCVTGDKLLFTSFPVEGSLKEAPLASMQEPDANARLEAYDLREQKLGTLVEGVTDFDVSANGQALAYWRGHKLRVVPATAKLKPDNGGEKPGRESGWIDLARIKVSVDPGAEWRQMYHEAWRLQRDFFWNEEMSNLDWMSIRERYLPLVDRVASRSEFSDLIWELHGELGTSHAYEFGGDYRTSPQYRQGHLGADLIFDEQLKAWRIERIIEGDVWDRANASPLAAPSVNVRPGDTILAVANRKVDRRLSPAQCLVNMADQHVRLVVADPQGKNPRTVTVQALASERGLRYRDWVEWNRRRVHEETGGRAGYLHIPNMGPAGYAEFHRYFIAEHEREGLVVDVRYNGGGHVSQLLLEKLLRRRIAWIKPRWFARETYPEFAPAGPMVALTNERAGSDGDIFSHAFKLYGCGPLIGTRTWGGVVGIWPRNLLVDGSMTTQPEFPFYFEDVGYGVENYGTEPDIEVVNRPQDYATGRDPQLARAIAEIKKMLGRKPAKAPDLTRRPPLPSARLPRRKKR